MIPIKKDQVRITGITCQTRFGSTAPQLLVDVIFEIDLDNPFETRRDYTDVGKRIRTLIFEHSLGELNKVVEIIVQDLLLTYSHTDSVEVTIYEQHTPVSHAQFATLKLNRTK